MRIAGARLSRGAKLAIEFGQTRGCLWDRRLASDRHFVATEFLAPRTQGGGPAALRLFCGMSCPMEL
jgi:hypothetical protein